MTVLETALAVLSGGLALVLVLALVVVGRRAGRRADERIAAAVRHLNTRMESLVAELSRALERAEAESRRNRLVGDLTGSIDLDDVLAGILEAAAEVADADAALVRLADAIEGQPLVATLGLSAEEAQRHGLVTGPPDGRPARSVGISFGYDETTLAADGDLIHAGVAVPLRPDGGPVGHLAVFTRTRDRGFGDPEVAELEELAHRAAPAIENAVRFREARQLADLDALTGLHNRRFFHETLEREVARAHRYGRDLALLVLDLDGFKTVNDRVGHLAGDGVLAEAAERLRGVVRSADVACRVGGDEFAVLLPEASLAEADRLSRRIREAVSAQPLGHAGALSVSAGVAALAPSDDAGALFQRADDALYRAKENGRPPVAATPRPVG